MRFSVIVPFLNESHWLPGTLAALHQQTLPATAFELLFVDNGSTDGSADLVRQHPGARLLWEPRRDPYLARNHGIENARGEYLVFLDADCPPEPGWLAALDQAVTRAPADILIGALLMPAGASLALRTYEAYYNTKAPWLLAHGRTHQYFGHAGNMAIHRGVFASCGLFEAMPIVGDTEIIHRLLARHPDAVIRFVADARVTHAEVDSLGTMLAKLVETGGYSQHLVPVSTYRPIALIDKLRILLATARGQRWGPMPVAVLCAVLGMGWVAYLLGRLEGWMSPGGAEVPLASRTP